MNNSISLRVGLVIILVLIGFVFPPSFALVALIAFSIYDDISKPTIDEPTGHDKLKGLTSESEGWLDSFHAICESPAETGFLDVMVSEFNLKPENGLLLGEGLTLRMQVPVSCYRLDFLVDSRLVVEVDGAAYHSSPEAVERDQTRDSFLNDLGYEVLRIPAKITLYSPHEVIPLIKSARMIATRKGQEDKLKKKERVEQVKDSFRPVKIASALKDAAISVGDSIGKATDYVHREAEKVNEKDRLEVERRTENELRAIQEELKGNEERKKLFEETRKLFD